MIEEIKDPKYYEYQNFIEAKREIQKSYDRLKEEEKKFQNLQYQFKNKYGRFYEVDAKNVEIPKTYYQNTPKYQKKNLTMGNVIAIIFLTLLVILAIYVQINVNMSYNYSKSLF